MGILEENFIRQYDWENKENMVQDALSVLGDKKQNDNKNIYTALKMLYQKSLTREKQFINTFNKKTNNNNKIKYPKLQNKNRKDIETYRIEFNKIINDALAIKNDDALIKLFRNSHFINRIAGQVSTLSSTQANKRLNLAGRDSEFLIKSQELIADYLKNKKPDKKSNEKLIEDMADIITTWNINSDDIWENMVEKIANEIPIIVSKEFEDFKEFNSSTLKNQKGVSAKLEKKIKEVYKQAVRQALSGEAEYEAFNKKQDVLEIHTKYGDIEDGFHQEVNLKLRDSSGKPIQKDKAITIFLNFLEKQIGEEDQNALSQLKRYKSNIRAIFKRKILQYIKKSDMGMNSDKDVLRILSSYGYAQVKGLLGELAAALQFDKPGSSVSAITGSDASSAGQINIDVAVMKKGQFFGIQVKNYEKLQVNNLYATSFNANSENNLKKYFGDDSSKYAILFANGKIISNNFGFSGEDSFKDSLASSFYNYTDNFLRISTGDLEGIFHQSDVFLLKDQFIPSSYLIAQAFWQIQNQLKSEEKRHKASLYRLQGDFPTEKTKEQTNLVLTNPKGPRIIFEGISFVIEEPKTS